MAHGVAPGAGIAAGIPGRRHPGTVRAVTTGTRSPTGAADSPFRNRLFLEQALEELLTRESAHE